VTAAAVRVGVLTGMTAWGVDPLPRAARWASPARSARAASRVRLDRSGRADAGAGTRGAPTGSGVAGTAVAAAAHVRVPPA
jgi:hypothetical protein